MSVSQPNSTWITDRPTPDELRTACTPVAPLRTDSRGNVISVSTSSGASPGASVMIVTRGRLRSGKTSIGSRESVTLPYTSRTIARTIVSSR